MLKGKRTPLFVTLIGLVVVILAVAVGWRLVNGDGSLLRNVTVEHDVITPNADGENDVTRIAYEISRNAIVSIYLENEAGDRFYFRDRKRRGAGAYRVHFSGVVDGYRLPGETIAGEIETRLLQDGTYTWTVAAEDEAGTVETAVGQITIADADPVLPEIRDFTIYPPSRVFTPNRDGLNDRAQPQFWLEKDVASIRVFLQDVEGETYPITELERETPTGERGYHVYDYDAGIDDGATPPPDGIYRVVAVAQDEEGQRVRVEEELTIQFGGVPRADIFPPPAGETVEWNTTAVFICDILQFTLTVRNYGETPIRTSGPAPGLVYDSDWNYNSIGWPTESGVYRVGIGFENALRDYPYRWAIGNVEDLELIGNHYYLMPGERAVVTGGIRVVDEFGVRNPQPVWAGLIHEDVQIAQFNNRVDPVQILVDIPDEENRPTCEERPLPQRADDPLYTGN